MAIERVAEALLASLLPNVRNQLASCAPECSPPPVTDVIIVVIALIATSFAVAVAVVAIEMWPWLRKRPDVAKESDDERRST
jgi:hypothetical protein